MTFEEFLDVHLPALTRYAGVLTGDRQLGHDVLTQALIGVARSWPRAGSVASPLAYARAAVSNAFLDHCRQERRRRSDATADVPDRLVDGGTSRVDDRAELKSLLNRLPARQRVVLVLRYYVDLPDTDIGRELGCSAATVRSLAARGLTALRATAANSREI